MRATTGFQDLILLMAFMVGCMPFLILLAMRTQVDQFKYLDDKTVLEDSIPPSMLDYVHNPKGTGEFQEFELAPTVSYADLVMMAAVNDDYVPEDANIRLMENWMIEDGESVGTVWLNPTNMNITNTGFYLNFKQYGSWRQNRYTAFQQLYSGYFNNGHVKVTPGQHLTDEWYLRWYSGSTPERTGWIVSNYPLEY